VNTTPNPSATKNKSGELVGPLLPPPEEDVGDAVEDEVGVDMIEREGRTEPKMDWTVRRLGRKVRRAQAPMGGLGGGLLSRAISACEARANRRARGTKVVTRREAVESTVNEADPLEVGSASPTW
jgi:hypothetical protein